MEFSYLSSCGHTLLFAGWGCKKQPVLHLFKEACFFSENSAEMFAFDSWEWCSFSSFLCWLPWTAKDVQVLSWQKVEKCQEIQRRHTELHQPGTCPITFILGRRGSINISTGLERTPFYVLITCFKWTFLEISSCSKMTNWLVASLCQHTHQPHRVHNSLQGVRILQ